MKKRYTVTLNVDIVKLAKKKAIDEGTSLSSMIESLLIAYINEDKERMQ